MRPVKPEKLDDTCYRITLKGASEDVQDLEAVCLRDHGKTMVTEWEPTVEELITLREMSSRNGIRIRLWVTTNNAPFQPVAIDIIGSDLDVGFDVHGDAKR